MFEPYNWLWSRRGDIHEFKWQTEYVFYARNYVVVEDEYHFLLICNDFKLFMHKYVTFHSPPYDVTHSEFQTFINLTPLRAGVVFIRQNLTSVDVRF